MSKLFNAQNLSNSKWKGREYLIYFTNNDGAYQIYRYIHQTGEHKLAKKNSELLKAEQIYISYSYLGGIHLCNYSQEKSINGNQTVFTFTLNKVQGLQGDSYSYWDIPNAIFELGDTGSWPNRGLEPVYQFNITFTADMITNTQLITFTDQRVTQNNQVRTTDYGVQVEELSSETRLTIYDHNSRQVVTSGLSALNSVFDAGRSPSPMYFSFRAGVYDENWVFEEDYGLVAAFYSFVKNGNSWYRRLYFVDSSQHSFEIDSEPDDEAIVAILENPVGTSDMDQVGNFMAWETFGYYQFNNDFTE